MIELFWKGIVIGILVSAPMGPIGMLCIQRTLNKGRWHGFITGIGATVSDLAYAALTCLCMGLVVNFVEANQGPLQLFGSLVLAGFGYYIFKSNPTRSLAKHKEKKLSFAQDFISAFFLTFSNVLIVLLYIALFARFGFVLPNQSIWMVLSGLLGVAIGAIAWWFFITSLVSRLRKWFNVRGTFLLNRIVGSIIIGLSIIGFLSVLFSSYFNLPLLHIR